MTEANLGQTRPQNLGDETLPDEMQEEEKVAEDQSKPAAIDSVQTAEPAGSAESGQDDVEETSVEPVIGGPPPGLSEQKTGGNPWRWLYILSFAALVFIAGVSAFGGYRSGINQRTSLESTLVASEARKQFDLGVTDMQEGRYEIARQRFEHVINLNPNYPGVIDRLAAVRLELNTTATPTSVPTPTLTPTPDLRSAEELFSQAQLMLAEGNWSEAIDTLLKLRKDEPDYQPIEVDGMLYVALRNRGVQRILNEGELESGTYDLALAQRFGPLDIEASNYRTWSDLYLTGASYWGLDWGQAVINFQEILIPAPNLRDASGMTTTERYRIASIRYGDVLAGLEEYCLAQQQYENAFSVGSDPAVEPTASWVTQRCERGEDDDDDRPRPRQDTPTPPPPEEQPTATPGGEPYPEPTEGPTQEPTPYP